MRKISLGLILVIALCTASQAHIAYTTSNGNLGLITINEGLKSGTPSVRYSGIRSDTLTASYWDGSEARLIVVERTQDTATSGDTALIFDPSSLSSPLGEGRFTLEGAYNIQSVTGSYNGNSIFAASRENGSIIEFDTVDFEPGHSYTYKPESGDLFQPRALSVLSDIYSVYSLASIGPSRSVFMRFDGQLKEDVEDVERIEIDYQASAMEWLSRGRIAALHSGGIDLLSRGEFISFISSDYPVKSVCPDAEDGLYFITQAQSGDVYTNNLYHYDGEEIVVLRENETGSKVQVLRDDLSAVLGVMIGGKIFLYDLASDFLTGEFDSSDLGGEAVSMSGVSAYGDDGHRSSGCEVSGAGLILLMACVKLFRKK